MFYVLKRFIIMSIFAVFLGKNRKIWVINRCITSVLYLIFTKILFHHFDIYICSQILIFMAVLLSYDIMFGGI